MKLRPIQIILVDDHDLVRESLRQVLEQREEIKVVSTCKNGNEALEHASAYQPDIMLIDVHMSPINGYETTRMILEAGHSTKIIGLSMNNQPAHAHKMMDAGAMGYITKSSPVHEIIQGIFAVFNGDTYICNEIKEKM